MREFKPGKNNAKREFRGKTRPSSSERGYDSEWKRLRDRYIALHPICENSDCREKAREVDHKQPFSGVGDPKRLEWRNLQALCRRHHALKTHKDKRNLCGGEGTQCNNG